MGMKKLLSILLGVILFALTQSKLDFNLNSKGFKIKSNKKEILNIRAPKVQPPRITPPKVDLPNIRLPTIQPPKITFQQNKKPKKPKNHSKKSKKPKKHPKKNTKKVVQDKKTLQIDNLNNQEELKRREIETQKIQKQISAIDQTQTQIQQQQLSTTKQPQLIFEGKQKQNLRKQNSVITTEEQKYQQIINDIIQSPMKTSPLEIKPNLIEENIKDDKKTIQTEKIVYETVTQNKQKKSKLSEEEIKIIVEQVIKANLQKNQQEISQQISGQEKDIQSEYISEISQLIDFREKDEIQQAEQSEYLRLAKYIKYMPQEQQRHLKALAMEDKNV